MRVLSTASALTLAATTAPLLLATGAYAAPSAAAGSVTLHDGATGEAAGPGDPRLCTFFLDAAGFAHGQRLSWEIVERNGSGGSGTVAETGTLTLDRKGAGRTGKLALADGSYQLVWTERGDSGGGRRAFFTVDCADDGEERTAAPSTSGSASVEPRPSRSTAPTPTGSPERSGEGTDSPESPQSPEPTPPDENDSGGSTHSSDTPADGDARTEAGDLAESGAGVPPGALITGAACLLGAGSYLLLRHRNTRATRPGPS